MLLSDVSVAYIRPKSRTERPRKTKIVTRDSDTTFKVKGQLVADVLNSQHVGTGATLRINTKILSTCRGRRHIMAATHFFLVILTTKPMPGRFLSTQKHVFGSGTVKFQPIWIKFCTPIVVRNTLVGQLGHDRRVGGSRPNKNDCFL